MFSAGDDKLVKCWDLEQNKVGDTVSIDISAEVIGFACSNSTLSFSGHPFLSWPS